MSDQSPVRASHPADLNGALRFVALIAVVIGVLVLAAAAFVLSYAGIHAIALTAGVSPRLARLYPLIFDALLVVASAAILSLRGAGLLMRCYAWLSMLVLLCAAAAADALHATGTRLPHRTSAATVAIIPWALALLGFGLLLAMLRHARLRRAQASGARANTAPAATPPAVAALTPGMQAAREEVSRGGARVLEAGAHAAPGMRANRAAGLSDGRGPTAAAARTETLPPGEPAGRAAVPAGRATVPAPPTVPSWPSAPSTSEEPGGAARHGDNQTAELALDAEPANDDPTSDEARSEGEAPARWVPHARTEEQPVTDDRHTGDYPAPVMSPAPVMPSAPIMSPAPVADVIPGRDAQPDPARHAAPDPLARGDAETSAERLADAESQAGESQAGPQGQADAESRGPAEPPAGPGEQIPAVAQATESERAARESGTESQAAANGETRTDDGETPAAAEPDQSSVPPFNRMRSSPVPPDA